MIKKILSLLFLCHNLNAAEVKNVKILDMKFNQNNLELKLRSQKGATGSYFFLEITKNDPEAFEKMSHIIKKIKYNDKYNLNLNIPSFSDSPNGSYYKSEGISFNGLLIKNKNGKNK